MIGVRIDDRRDNNIDNEYQVLPTVAPYYVSRIIEDTVAPHGRPKTSLPRNSHCDATMRGPGKPTLTNLITQTRRCRVTVFHFIVSKMA